MTTSQNRKWTNGASIWFLGELLFLSEELGPVFAKKHPRSYGSTLMLHSKNPLPNSQRNTESKPNDELTKCFNDLFITFPDGERKKVRATDKQHSGLGEKGLDERSTP